MFFPVYVFLADQLLHVDILDMAAAYKFEVHRYRLANEKETDVNDEEVTVSIMADLQEEQDKESEGILAQLQEKVNTEHKSLHKENAFSEKRPVYFSLRNFLLNLFPPTFTVFNRREKIFLQALSKRNVSGRN